MRNLCVLVVLVSASLADEHYEGRSIRSPQYPGAYLGVYGRPGRLPPQPSPYGNLYGCRNCGGYYGKPYYGGYGRPGGYGKPGGYRPSNNFVGSAASSSVLGGGLAQSSSHAQSETASINFGPLQATYTKNKASASAQSVGK